MINWIIKSLNRNHRYTILGFNDRPLFWAACFINTNILMGILYMDLFLEGPFKRFVAIYIGVFCYIMLHYVLMRAYYLYLLNQYPGFNNRTTRIVLLPIVLVIYLLTTLLLDIALDPFLAIEDPLHNKPPISKELLTGTLLILLNVGVYQALQSLIELEKVKQRSFKLEKDHALLKLKSLEEKTNPRFLFNSLNTLLFLMDESHEKSKQFVLDLSYLYQKLLQNSKSNTIPLEHEIEHITIYSRILKERYRESFEMQITGTALADKHIIPLTLFLLLEQILKTTYKSKNKPLLIRLTIEKDKVVLNHNNLNQETVTPKDDAIALINGRYTALTSQLILQEKKENWYYYRVPLIVPS